MKQKVMIEFDHDAGYATIKCNWAEPWADQNWDFWMERIKPIISVGCLEGILYDQWQKVSPTTIAFKYSRIEREIKGDM